MKHDAKHRAALHAAGHATVYAGMRTNAPFLYPLLAESHQIAGILGGHAAEAVHGFSFDLDARLRQAHARRSKRELEADDEVLRAYRKAMAARRTPAATERHVRSIWQKTVAYLSEPSISSVTLKLAGKLLAGLPLQGRNFWPIIRNIAPFDSGIADRDAMLARLAEERRKQYAAEDARWQEEARGEQCRLGRSQARRTNEHRQVA